MKIVLTAVVAIAAAVGLCFAFTNNESAIEVAKNEIELRIQLDTKENIYLIEYTKPIEDK